MKSRISFKDILNIETRWPMEGDELIVVSDEPFDNANISDDKFTRLVLMMKGYKMAADMLIERSLEDWRIRDMLVFPVIFNYRHFLELSLKYHLAVYGPRVGIQPNWKNHQLKLLWDDFLAMLKRYGTEYPNETDHSVGEKIIIPFDKIDPLSYSHRYPVDKNGNPVQVTCNDLSLPNLKDVMDKIESYFNSCDGYLDSLAKEL